jgi:hypothetical protein
MANQLADLGEPVRDHTLVLNVLCGLNDCFAHGGLDLAAAVIPDVH